MGKVFEYYSTIHKRDVEWLWYPYIACGKITILQGDPGEGKSTVAIRLSALLSTAGILPDGTRKPARYGIYNMLIIEEVQSIVALGVERICRIWKDAGIRAVGVKRATTLYEAAKRSIGHDQGTSAAKLEMALLLEDYEAKAKQLAFVMAALETTLREIPEAEKLLTIKGIGIISVAGFLAEVGDLRRFESPKQIQKLAGLSLRENSSGKHKGQTTISRRGRDKLRQVLFNAVIPLLATNEEFRSLHLYFTTRTVNPLKKKQSAIALCGKLIRVFYAIMVHGVEYDGKKMLADIHRNESMTA